MIPKIKEYHKEKMAYVYLRQSTMGQVLHHQESTERQYSLKNRALACGWPMDKIRILDGDLGISGTHAANREDFKLLVADVSLNKVGAIFALEASRLSRSSTDWNRLFELCSLTDTLIIDEDGCYDPADFNDQLLLGLKGMMSQAELHFIRARLHGGKLNKAKKGMLRFPLPVGFCYDEKDTIILDPDEEIRSVVKLLFKTFKETGSAYGVGQKFGHLNLKFPKRAYGGVWKGKLIWGRLTYMRILGILKNPSYAGAYVYGRYQCKKFISTNGTICSKIELVPMSSWQVLIKDHHEGYISWEEYLRNLSILQQNQTNGVETMLSSAAREGLALLQGILICGVCGRRMTVRYQGNGGLYPIYECNWRKREGLTGKSCLMFRCDIVDQAVATRILEVVKSEQIEIALKAQEEFERRNRAVDNQWRMRIERAEYEAQLAQRRYEEVDPSNRLVAATLEKRWNDALVNLEQIKQQHQELRKKEHLELTPEQKKKVFALTQDLPRLWKAPTTQTKDRKRMIRLLIKDITVEKILEHKKLILHVRWQGGATEDIHCDLPLKINDRIRYSRDFVEKVRELAKKLPDEKIAELFNREGRLSATRKPFSKSIIRHIRSTYSIPAPILKRSDELTVKEIADRFDVSPGVVYYWIERGYLKARRIKMGLPYWITLKAEDEENLRQRILISYKLHGKENEHSYSSLREV
jgi:DNA invertase Pin-like site-specific DNA recombinase